MTLTLTPPPPLWQDILQFEEKEAIYIVERKYVPTVEADVEETKASTLTNISL
jgi:hypothetical protein